MIHKPWIALPVAMAIFWSAPSTGLMKEAPISLAQDAENTIGGIGVACTGIGDSKEDARWGGYPLRIEFANDRQEYLIGTHVRVIDTSGTQLINVTCWGAWVLLKPPGRESYRIEATIIGESAPARGATVQAPASGQTRIVIEFPGVDA